MGGSRCSLRPAWCACVALLIAAISLVAPASAEDRVQITGRVVDDQGRPVADYQVAAAAPYGLPRAFRRRLHSSVTDDEGRFAIKDLYPGEYRLYAPTSASETHSRFPLFPLLAGGGEVTLHVVRYRTIDGIAHDPTGNPLHNARVWVGRPALGGERAPTRTKADEFLVRVANTDETGRFQIDRYPSTVPVLLRIHPPTARQDELLAHEQADVIPGGSRIEATLQPAQTVSGQVVDENGRPVVGALVRGSGALRYLRDGLFTGFERSTRTDADGRFALRPYTKGESCNVTVTGPERDDPAWFRGYRRDVRGGDADLRVVLFRGLALSGEVEGVPAEALVGLSIMVIQNRLQVGSFSFDGTSSRFRIQPLREGKVTFQFRQRPKKRLVIRGQTEADASATGLRLEAALAHVVRGRIEGERDASDLYVHVHDGWAQKHTYKRVREDGSFEVPGIAPGSAFLWVTASDQKPQAVLDTVDPASAPLRFRLEPRRSIIGRVRGLPRAVERGLVIATRGPLALRTAIEADGWFEITDLAPGEWDLQFKMSSPRGDVEPLTGVSPGDDVLPVWSDAR